MFKDTKQRSQATRTTMIVLGILACLAAPLSSHNPVVENAKRYSVEIAASAVALYASLRLINSVLSTAMETEVSGGALLVSGTVQPLKVLEPVDDTVERVAAVVFALALVAGILSVGLAPAAGIGFALLGVGMIGLAFAPLRLPPWLETIFANARRLGLSFGLVLPLGLLVAFYGGGYLTQKAVANASLVITSMTETLGSDAVIFTPPVDEIVDDPATGFSGVVENLQSRLFDGAASISGSAADIAQSTGRYLELAGTVMARADELFISFAELLVAFLFQLIVFPALVILLLFRLLGNLGRPH